jgi:ABC-type multidrug transport system fused ATPase/permease subunit
MKKIHTSGKIKVSLNKASKLFSRKELRKIGQVTLAQVFLNFLDLAGVAIIGLLGGLVVNGIQSKNPGTRTSQVLIFLHLDQFGFHTQIAILGSIASIVLLTKTLISMILNRRILYYLSFRTSTISGKIISAVLRKNLTWINARTSQEILFGVTTGVSVITMGLVGATIALIADSTLLLLMSIGLFIVDPWIAIATGMLFGSIGAVLIYFLQFKARKLGLENSLHQMKSNNDILEVLGTYREAIVRNRRDYYSNLLVNGRIKLASNSAELAFIPSIGKYVIEIAVVLGSVLLCAFQFLKYDSAHAIATLSIFLAAGTRIAPAVLRVQQGLIQMGAALSSAEPTFKLIEDLGQDELNEEITDAETEPEIDVLHSGFTPSVAISNIDFRYPNQNQKAISGISLSVKPGEVIAFVGPSGAGKTTLADLILGVFEPANGDIKVSGMHPLEAIKLWPGAIGYVPQETVISIGSIAENVALGYPVDNNEALILDALEKAQLLNFVNNLPNGINTQVGQSGNRLSGGQRQRLGIARALFTRPKIVVLDEATSSLDAQTEYDLSESINSLKGEVTTFIIAHRLSTVRHADKVVYLEHGNVLSVGTFEQVKRDVPNFKVQANLMGI